jgi:integrase
MLGVLEKGLGSFSLEQLAGDPLLIERWLNKTQKERNWSDNTWNRYYQLLSTICVRAVRWKTGGVGRMATNPMSGIERRLAPKRKFGVRLEETIEDRLLAACDLLNGPHHRPHSILLNSDKVGEIRARVAAGETQAAVARHFGISTGLCNQIVKRHIWNPENYKSGAKGDLMRLRVYMAFDAGARAGEMMLIQLKHINFQPIAAVIDRQSHDVLKIEVQSKGEKMTGQKEHLLAGTDRLKDALKKRRDALRNDPDAFVFGREDGRYQRDFKKMWRKLFTLAGLDWGRDKGIVWHTLRHEFCSRTAEITGDPVVTQELARHKDLRTTQGYLHPRESRVLAAAVRLNRQPERKE